MTDFTLEQAREAWHEVVAERGEDFVYSDPGGCWYGPHSPTDGDYGCAIGGVLSKLAPEVFEKFKEFEDVTGTSFRIAGAAFSLDHRDLERILCKLNVDPKTREYLAFIQKRQDIADEYDSILRGSETLYETLIESRG